MKTIVKSIRAGGLSVFETLFGLCWKTVEALVAIFEFRVDVVILRGQIRGGDDGEEVSLLYVGRRLNLPHFKKKFFVDPETVEFKKANLLTFRKHMKAAEQNADVMFVDVGWPYNGRVNSQGEFLELPDWVCMIVPFEKDWDSTVMNFRKTMRKNIGRLIRRNNYRCEPTNDPAIIERFYDDLYVPFINSRHAGEAFLTSRTLIEKRAREGVILQVMGDEGLVAAGIYYTKGSTFFLVDAGMPASHVENPPEAALWALYYFSLQYGFESGCKDMNFMGTRAFPTNGVFQFKRKWGARVEDSFSIDSILFKPMNNRPKAARFCELFPFIARNDDGLELVVCATGESFGEVEYQRMLADHHCEGIAQAKVVHLSASETSPEFSNGALALKVINSDLTNFSENFTQR